MNERAAALQMAEGRTACMKPVIFVQMLEETDCLCPELHCEDPVNGGNSCSSSMMNLLARRRSCGGEGQGGIYHHVSPDEPPSMVPTVPGWNTGESRVWLTFESTGLHSGIEPSWSMAPWLLGLRQWSRLQPQRCWSTGLTWCQ